MKAPARMLLWPRRACTSRRLAPRSLRRSVAAVCRRGWAEMTGTRARSQASLSRALKALLLKGRAVPARKDEHRSREVDSPSPQPHAFDAFQEGEPSFK